MSFIIHCEPEIGKLGRSSLEHGLEFIRHPESQLRTPVPSHAGSPSTPGLSLSAARTDLSTSINTPKETQQKSMHASDISHARQLTHRLSLAQLGSQATSTASAATNTRTQQPYLQQIWKRHLETPRSPDEPLALDFRPTTKPPPSTDFPVESVAEESPFQPWELPEKVSDKTISLPLALQNNTKSARSTLTVSEYLYPGYLWDFWLADHSDYGKVVLKLVYIPKYPCNNPEYDDYLPQKQIEEQALKEEEYYMGPLEKLQGDLVPIYHGLYETKKDGWHIAILLEYIDHPIGPGTVEFDDQWKDKLYSAYERLHLLGIQHGDICSRHILIDKDERIRLISFRRSLRRDLTIDTEVDRVFGEAVLVRRRLGLEQTGTFSVVDIPSSYYAQLEDPDKFRQELIEGENTPLPDWVIEYNRELREDPWGIKRREREEKQRLQEEEEREMNKKRKIKDIPQSDWEKDAKDEKEQGEEEEEYFHPW
ncbi:uncharacterized protein L201_002011 [Kwoniella dendrophila CBS 6074]|uniref:Protein kinase domain-containing protein n=1 Tax=Kwoniella dendrophila CBS 6074 TaxID=1295534 RepID=A0AAX4JRK8_9TREE